MADGKVSDLHHGRMERALELARKSPPNPSNYRVGAILVDTATGDVLSTGYTLELPSNTHAEQCCFAKLAQKHGVADEKALAKALSSSSRPLHRLALYTTMEPCSHRLSGNLPCVQRVLRMADVIAEVYVGVVEPDTFVARNTGRKTLEDAGISVVHVPGLEEEILKVAMAGHVVSEPPAATALA